MNDLPVRIGWLFVGTFLVASSPAVRLAVVEPSPPAMGAAWCALLAVVLAGGLSLCRGRGTAGPWAAPVAVLAAAVLGIVVAPDGARGAAVAVVVLAALAQLAIRPLGAGARGLGRPVPLAVGATVVASLGWLRTGAAAHLLVPAAVAILLLAVARRWPSHLARATEAIVHGVTVVVEAVLAALLAVAVTLLLYVPVGLFRLARRLLPGRSVGANSSWTATQWTAERERRDAGVPFASPPPVVRTRRLASGVVVALALVAVALVAAEVARARSAPDAATLARIDQKVAAIAELAPSDPGVDGAEVLREQSTIPFSTDAPGGLAMGDYTSASTNIRNGERRTLHPRCPGCPTVVVWWLGGSAAFGEGQRDDHTIASELARLAAADGLRLDIRNLAIPGGVRAQGSALARAAWDSGEHGRPDAIIRYEGFNEVVYALAGAASAAPGRRGQDGVDPVALRFLGSNDPRVAQRLAAAGGPRGVGEDAGRGLRELRARDDAWAKARGIVSLAYFQPDALASTVQLRSLDGRPTLETPEQRTWTDQAIEGALGSLPPADRATRHLFDDRPPGTFIDEVHQDEAGARIVARDLYRRFRRQLLAAARRR